MSGGVEMQERGASVGTSKGVPVIDPETKELESYGVDGEWPNIYKSRGKPRVVTCGSGLYCRAELNPGVFGMSVLIIWAFIIWAYADTKTFNDEFSRLAYTVIVQEYSWLYITAINIFGIFCFYLCFSKMGTIILAPPDNPTPDFPYYSWFSMLFSAGVGIGLFFFGVWEPLQFYLLPTRVNYTYILPRCPVDNNGAFTSFLNCCNDFQNPAQCFDPKSRYIRANSAMNIAWFDWGIAASACYVVFGLPLAFYHYRYGMPLSVRSGFYPLIGNRIYGWFGDFTDGFCIIGTIFGVCTSLGLGVTQMVTGMTNINDKIQTTTDTYIIVICCITVVATMSVVTGLDVGIRRLSEVNFTIGILLLVMVFILGKAEFFLDFYTQMLGYHLQHLPETSMYGGAMERHVDANGFVAPDLTADPDSAAFWGNPGGIYPGTVHGNSYPENFESNWTIFYWGWWFSWSPFVGTFLARISKGRTVREFIIGNMVVPTLLTSLWFTIFGGSGFMIQFLAENQGLDCYEPAGGLTAFLTMVKEGDGVTAWDYEADQGDGCMLKFDKWRMANLGKVGKWDLCNLDDDKMPRYMNLGCRIAPGQWGGRSLLFDVLQYFSFAGFTQVLAIIGLFTYFITSSDSASQVCDMIASNGDLEPPYWQRVFWSVTEGTLAIILVTAGAVDGKADTTALWAVLAASITAGFPLVLIMLVLTYAIYKGLVLEQAIADGEDLKEQKQYMLPFPDALVQMIGRCCCGIGTLWCKAGAGTVNVFKDCAAACCSCLCPHLVIVRGLVMTTSGVVMKVLTAIAVLVPWILMLVFFGLCPAWIRAYNTKTDIYFQPDPKDDDSCQDPGYYALGIAMYLILVGMTMCFRNRVRERAGIDGNACEDIVMTIFCPQVTVYQSFYQVMNGGAVEPRSDAQQTDATTGAIKDKGQV